MNSDTIRDRNMERKQLDAWLTAEQGGDEDAADAALAHVFAAVPKVQPRSVFVEQAVVTAWRWRARHRWLSQGTMSGNRFQSSPDLGVGRYQEGLTQPEIAEILGLPAGTVKTYLHRARKELAEILAGEGWGPASVASTGGKTV